MAASIQVVDAPKTSQSVQVTALPEKEDEPEVRSSAICTVKELSRESLYRQ